MSLDEVLSRLGDKSICLLCGGKDELAPDKRVCTSCERKTLMKAARKYGTRKVRVSIVLSCAMRCSV